MENPFEAQHKIDLVKAVLQCRADILERVIKTDNPNAIFFRGKLEGYNQAIDLLGESVDSIRVEL